MNPIATISKDTIPDVYKDHWVILWDGDCGFCRRSVEWIKAQDKKNIFKTSAYQDHQSWLPQNIYKLSKEQVHLLSPNGEFWGGAEAVRRTLQLIDYKMLSTFLGLPFFRIFNELGYKYVARNRMLFSKLFFRK